MQQNNNERYSLQSTQSSIQKGYPKPYLMVKIESTLFFKIHLHAILENKQQQKKKQVET